MHVVFVAMSARLALIQKKIKHSKDSLFHEKVVATSLSLKL
jgi:hypothetical protein